MVAFYQMYDERPEKPFIYGVLNKLMMMMMMMMTDGITGTPPNPPG